MTRTILTAILLPGLLLAQVEFVERPLEELGIDEFAGTPAFVDYNSDGLIDFWAGLAYLNNGNGTFSKLTRSRWGGGERVCFGDYDNDGYPDILTNRARSGTTRVRIYRNDGPPDWTVTEVTNDVGIGIPILERDLVDAVWFDYDNDGWLDVYVSSYEYPFPVGHEDYLFHSIGGDSFADVSATSGVNVPHLCSRGVSVSDFDEDGDADVFVSVYRLEPNLLWQNQGDGTFQDVAAGKGVAGLYIQNYYGHNIGAQWGDYNGDGHQDLMSPITHHSGYPGDSTGHLWLNSGPPDYDFTCHWPGSGLRNTEIGSAPSCGDYDNDGNLDLFFVNLYGQPQADAWLYRNNGDTTFTDVTRETGLYFFGQRKDYCIFVDFNEDGFLDVFWPRNDGRQTHYEFLENNAGADGHWVEVDLVGTASNRSGIGARIDVFCADWRAVREVHHAGGHGYGSPFVARQHFGLGDHETIDSLVIRWPSGTRDVYRDLPADRFVRSTEGMLALETHPARARPRPADRLSAALCRTGIKVSLTGSPPRVPECAILDGTGRRVALVALRPVSPGLWQGTWDGDGSAAGVYFCRARTEAGVVSTKALLLRGGVR